MFPLLDLILDPVELEDPDHTQVADTISNAVSENTLTVEAANSNTLALIVCAIMVVVAVAIIVVTLKKERKVDQK